ncbi:MAG: prolyl oligopeptidase family serine peptidase [Cyanobacteriota bacterium]
MRYSKAGPGLTLDLFLPRQASQPTPCVIVLQGGGFNAQDGQRFRPFAIYLAQNGFAAALVAYRGRPHHTYKDTVADVRTSVCFIRKISGQYGIDPTRIGAMGRSAGATLTALLAVGDGVEEFEGAGEHGLFSSRIQGGVGISGAYDFVARFTDEGQISLQPQLETKRQANSQWIGAAFAPTDPDWLRASAINHVDASDPPMLLMHSKDDPVVPWTQSEDMHEVMIQAGIASEIEIAEEGGHGGPPTLKESMLAFFRKIFLGK